MKKTIAAIALAGVIALTGSTPAIATTYPAPGTCATVSDGTVAPGETFTFSGTCFGPNQVITITVTLTVTPQAIGGFSGGASTAVPSKINLPLAPQTFTTTTNANGDFAFPLNISDPGTYTLTATGPSASYSTSVTVAGVAPGTGLANTGSTPLANTGADSSLVLWSLVGAGALAAGAASVITVRRRAKATEANG